MRFYIILLLLVQRLVCLAQHTPPKLVVGIVVDQMRYDYVFKYWDKYSEGGFKKMVNDGMFCKNVNYNYVPTYTAPGHAAIYTGTTPSFNGIIANDWFSRDLNKTVYCTQDTLVTSVGTDSKAGKMSPRNLLTTTVTDELRLHYHKESKVIGVALKDRGSILPAGHLPTAAYWHDSKTGNFITSSFYTAALPKWVNEFNDKKLTQNYLSKDWVTLLPIASYTESALDDNAFEGKFKGEAKPVFPHQLNKIMNDNGGLELVRYTPYGNSLTKDFAMQAIQAEDLGKDNYPDFLAISFSSTDYVGHMYGPQAVETQDTYLRLDKDIEELINYLELAIGRENFVVFLTADHAAAQAPSFAAESNIPGGYVDDKLLEDSLRNYLKKKYGVDVVSDFINQQLYLDHPLLYKKQIRIADVQQAACDFLNRFSYVESTIAAYTLNDCYYTNGVSLLIQNGYHTKRSGDVMVNYLPGWMEYHKTGTTHGSPYSYDTHVPLLWYGWKIRQGELLDNISITDIAPTVSVILNIPFPNATTGKPIPGLTK